MSKLVIVHCSIEDNTCSEHRLKRKITNSLHHAKYIKKGVKRRIRKAHARIGPNPAAARYGSSKKVQ